MRVWGIVCWGPLPFLFQRRARGRGERKLIRYPSGHFFEILNSKQLLFPRSCSCSRVCWCHLSSPSPVHQCRCPLPHSKGSLSHPRPLQRRIAETMSSRSGLEGCCSSSPLYWAPAEQQLSGNWCHRHFNDPGPLLFLVPEAWV